MFGVKKITKRTKQERRQPSFHFTHLPIIRESNNIYRRYQIKSTESERAQTITRRTRKYNQLQCFVILRRKSSTFTTPTHSPITPHSAFIIFISSYINPIRSNTSQRSKSSNMSEIRAESPKPIEAEEVHEVSKEVKTWELRSFMPP